MKTLKKLVKMDMDELSSSKLQSMIITHLMMFNDHNANLGTNWMITSTRKDLRSVNIRIMDYPIQQGGRMLSVEAYTKRSRTWRFIHDTGIEIPVKYSNYSRVMETLLKDCERVANAINANRVITETDKMVDALTSIMYDQVTASFLKYVAQLTEDNNTYQEEITLQAGTEQETLNISMEPNEKDQVKLHLMSEKYDYGTTGYVTKTVTDQDVSFDLNYVFDLCYEFAMGLIICME